MLFEQYHDVQQNKGSVDIGRKFWTQGHCNSHNDNQHESENIHIVAEEATRLKYPLFYGGKRKTDMGHFSQCI